jgi:hypothetical protein
MFSSPAQCYLKQTNKFRCVCFVVAEDKHKLRRFQTGTSACTQSRNHVSPGRPRVSLESDLLNQARIAKPSNVLREKNGLNMTLTGSREAFRPVADGPREEAVQASASNAQVTENDEKWQVWKNV